MKAMEANFGNVLTIHGAMAHSPVVLQSYVALQAVIADCGSFGARTGEAIALRSRTLIGAPTIRRELVDFDAKLAALLSLACEYTSTSATSLTQLGRRRSTPAGPCDQLTK